MPIETNIKEFINISGSLATLLAAAIGFFSAIIGAVVGVALKERWEKKKRAKDVLFRAYMLLLELYGNYWWETVAEFKKTQPNPQLRREIVRTAWKISDELRSADDKDLTREILEVLFSKDPNKYPSAKTRYDAIGIVINKLGQQVNPNHTKTMKDISKKNEQVMIERFKDGIPTGPIQENDPGGFSWF